MARALLRQSPMQSPVQIAFRHVTPSPALDAHVRRRVEKLSRYSHTIISCRVTIDTPPKHSHHGKSFRVVVDVVIPGTQRSMRATRMTEIPRAQDAHVAIDHAFAEVERQLIEHSHEGAAAPEQRSSRARDSTRSRWDAKSA